MNHELAFLFTAGLRLSFSHHAGVVSLAGNVHRHASVTGDQERLVAELAGASIGTRPGGDAALAAETAAEYVNMQAAAGERLGQRDGERRFAGAAGGAIADADDGKAETADRLQPGAKAEFAQGQSQAGGGNQRQKR